MLLLLLRITILFQKKEFEERTKYKTLTEIDLSNIENDKRISESQWT